MLYLTINPPNDPPELRRHLLSAEGYLTLGMPTEALAALEEIPAQFVETAATLRIRIRILLHLRRWKDAEKLSSGGMRDFPEENEFMVQRAFALQQQEKENEAASLILNAPSWIRNTGVLHYNLACYEAQLGNLGAARRSIRTAIEINAAFKKKAKNDPDLRPLWN